MARSPEPVLLLVYLDRYHLGDPLFLQRFAPVVKAHEGPLLVLHGAGEAAERVLEAEGRVVERVEGVLRVEDEAGRTHVERAARELNRRVVHALNDAGVSAVRLAGTDRGLLRVVDGSVVVGRVGWLRTLAVQGGVPVLALLAEAEGQGVEVEPGRALAALAEALEEEGDPVHPVVVLLAKSGPREEEGEEALLRAVAEPETAGRLATAGVRACVAPPASLRGAGVPAGADLPGGAV